MGGVAARPRQAPPPGAGGSGPSLASQDWGVTPRAHARALPAGRAPARRPFCLIGFYLEEAFFGQRAGPERLAAVSPAFSSAGAGAGGSSRSREAP